MLYILRAKPLEEVLRVLIRIGSMSSGGISGGGGTSEVGMRGGLSGAESSPSPLLPNEA